MGIKRGKKVDNFYANTTEDSIYYVHESRLPTFQRRLKNVNLHMAGNGLVSCSILGTEQAMYRDANGNTFDDTYYKVKVDGAVKFKGMECLGRISFANKDSDTSFAKKYSTNLSADDSAFLLKSHDRSCDCCGRKNERRLDFYAFKCTEDVTMNNENGESIKFEKGHYYKVGTSCVEKFMGKEAIEVVSDLTGLVDEQSSPRTGSRVKPNFYDVKKLTKYALLVGKYKIDEAYNCYRHNRAADWDLVERDGKVYSDYCSSVSYRHVNKSKSPYGYSSGSIIETAKAIYCLNELDPNLYNYDFYFASGTKDVDDTKRYVREICEETGFNRELKKKNSAIDKLCNKILSADENRTMISDLSSVDAFIASDKESLESISLIRGDYAQLLTDLCDDYLLKHESGTKKLMMHEDTEPLFKIKSYFRPGYYKSRRNYVSSYTVEWVEGFNGKTHFYPYPKGQSQFDDYDGTLKICAAKGHYSNDRVVDFGKKLKELSDDKVVDGKKISVREWADMQYKKVEDAMQAANEANQKNVDRCHAVAVCRSDKEEEFRNLVNGSSTSASKKKSSSRSKSVDNEFGDLTGSHQTDATSKFDITSGS